MELRESMKTMLEEVVREVLMTVVSLNATVKESMDSIGGSEEKMVVSIGLAGPLSASLALVLTNHAACQLVSRMLSSEIQEVSQDVVDGLGEIANIIAGRIKSRFHEFSIPLALSIPGVILGLDTGSVAKMRGSETISMWVDAPPVDFELFFLYSTLSEESSVAKNSDTGEGIPVSLANEAVDALKRLLKQKK